MVFVSINSGFTVTGEISTYRDTLILLKLSKYSCRDL